jgi:hypothetical protein
MNMAPIKSAMYLAGHGSYVRPRLIELQYWRIQRYLKILREQLDTRISDRDVFIDLRLPRFGMGQVCLQEVPGFERLLQSVKTKEFEIVFIDLDDGRQKLTPDYESGFVREVLEAAGARVLNVYTDDGAVFETDLKNKFGRLAREEDVTDSSDLVGFFPSLSSELISTALRRELQDPAAVESGALRKIEQRIEALKTLRPYSGGGRPFIEDRLSFEWQSESKDEFGAHAYHVSEWIVALRADYNHLFC